MVLQIPTQNGSQIKLYQAMHGPIYEAVLNLLGTTGTILPLADSHHSAAGATTLTTMGAEQLDFTWGTTDTAWSSFDGHDDIGDSDTFPYRYQGIIPFVDFNGTDEEADSPDAAYWTRGDGAGVDRIFSIGAWVHLTASASARSILTKFEDNGPEEWLTEINAADKPNIVLRDESAGITVSRLADNAISELVWHFVVYVYDADHGSWSGATAADYLSIYVDGEAVASSPTNNGSYASMDNTAAVVGLGQLTGLNLFNGKMAGGPMGPFFCQNALTAGEVLRLYELGRRALAL